MADDLSVPHPEEEGDVCRVCRVEGDEEMPLIHPCKCSGSVRFVHPDCLKMWLAQSQKKYCEICGHRYTFTKVYPEQLPTTIPITVYIRQTLLHILRYNLTFARICLVIAAWLVVLPSLNMFSLRSMIWLADHVASPTASENEITSASVLNATAIYDNGTVIHLVSNKSEVADWAASHLSAIVAEGAKVTISSNGSADENITLPIANTTQGVTVGDLVNRPISTLVRLVTVSVQHYMRGDADTAVGFVLRGQILSISIAAVLIGLILLREWITQHNWQEHDRPQTLNETPIKPDEWEIRNGVAKRKSSDEFKPVPPSNVERPKRHSTGDLKPGPISMYYAESDEGEEVDDEDSAAAVAPGSIEEALSAYRERHRQLLESIGTRSTPLADLDPPRSATSPNRADAVKSSDDETLPPSSIDATGALWSWHADAEAGPSQTRNDGTPIALDNDEPLSPGLSRPMSASSSGPGQKERNDVAFTAPELLSRSGKGKERAQNELGSSPALSNEDPSENAVAGAPSVPEAPRAPAEETIGATPSSSWDGIPPAALAGISPEELAAAAPEVFDAMRTILADPDRFGDPALAPGEAQDTATNRAALPSPIPILLEDIPTEEADTSVNDDADDDGDEGEWEDEPDDEADAAVAPGAVVNGEAVIGPVVRPARPARIRMDEMDQVEVEFIDELDGEGWDGEDWNGVLEVIGLIGPVHNLLQNILFAVIIMSASLTLLVGVPLILGKLFLAIDFSRAVLGSGAALLRLVRKVTDPVVDVVLEIVKEVLFLPLLSSLKAAEAIVARKLGLDTAPPPTPKQDLISKVFGLFSTSTAETTKHSAIDNFATRSGDIFALLGQYVYDVYHTYLSYKHHIANSDKMSDRVVCILTGYGAAGAAVALYALAGEAGLGRMTGDFAANVKHHAMFLKLAFFMVLELAVFPLGIGLVIDGCTVPLFDGATIMGRVEALHNSPFGTVFVDWLVGTIFMYQFATLLSHIRTLCRPGTLFFIRDPADPSYSPVKDIIEKTTFSQLRKLGVSAVMYSVVVFCLFGAACWGLAYQPFLEILPLRLEPTYGPLTSIPFDLLILHLLIPPAIDFIRPRQRGKRLMAVWWKWTVSLYRLSTLMAKRPIKTADGSTRKWEKIWGLVDPIFQVAFGRYDPTATNARVPASDQVALLPPAQRRAEGGVFVALDGKGRTKSEADKTRFLRQDKLARDNNRDPKKDYEVIALPQYWRTRVHVFIGSALVMSSAVIGLLVFVPLVVGRMALGWKKINGVHDGYNYLVGTFILVTSLSLGQFTRKHILLFTRAPRLRRSDTATRIKRTLKRWLAGLYGILMTYGFLPIVVGALLEMYVVGTCRMALDAFGGRQIAGEKRGVVVIHCWDIWANGTVLCSLFLGAVLYVRPRGGLMWIDLVRERLRNPAPKHFTTTNLVLLPTIKYLSVPLFLPLAISWTIALLQNFVDQEFSGSIFPILIPMCFTALALHYGSTYALGVLQRVRQSMIDAEYVLEERVENYVPEAEAEAEADADAENEGKAQDKAQRAAKEGAGADEAVEQLLADIIEQGRREGRLLEDGGGVEVEEEKVGYVDEEEVEGRL